MYYTYFCKFKELIWYDIYMSYTNTIGITSACTNLSNYMYQKHTEFFFFIYGNGELNVLFMLSFVLKFGTKFLKKLCRLKNNLKWVTIYSEDLKL